MNEPSEYHADERLARLRAEWPRHVSWDAVRADDPEAFRMAARGVWLLGAAVLATVLWLFLSSDLADSLPDWIKWMSPLLYIASLWGGIILWIGGIIMVLMPSDARRAIAVKQFGDAHGLSFMRFGFAPPRLGILFAEGTAAPLPKRLRTFGGKPAWQQEDPAHKSLYRSEFTLWRGDAAFEPELQIAIASFQGSKSDIAGPRNVFRYMTMPLARDLPHLMIDSLHNGRMNAVLPGSEKMSFEGDFDRHFAVYAPAGYQRDALELLTPDVMVCLLDYGKSWDIEVVEDRLIVASSKPYGWSDSNEVPALLHFAEVIAGELGHQVKTYTDPRSARPRSQIAKQGRRLSKRTAGWSTLILFAIVAGLLAFPHVLGWFLDNF